MATRRRRAHSGALLAFAVRLLEVSAAHGGGGGRAGSNGASTPTTASAAGGSPLAAFRPCHSSGRVRRTRTRNGVSASTPPNARRRGSALRYVDSSSGGGGLDAAATPSQDRPQPATTAPSRGEIEFTLLRPHLQFSEVDIQKICRDGVPGGGGGDARAPGRVHGALEERWRADAEEKQRGRNHRPVLEGTPAPDRGGSPFFFASVARESRDTAAEEASAAPEGPTPPSAPPRPSRQAALLPPWLLHVPSQSAPVRLRRLRSDLRPHLSAREAGSVIDAVRAAASGDPRKVAGAADFCSILVNSLELAGVSVLCAAAFHYCSLVAVREREVEEAAGGGGREECGVEEEECLRQAGADAKFLCALAGSGELKRRDTFPRIFSSTHFST